MFNYRDCFLDCIDKSSVVLKFYFNIFIKFSFIFDYVFFVGIKVVSVKVICVEML